MKIQTHAPIPYFSEKSEYHIDLTENFSDRWIIMMVWPHYWRMLAKLNRIHLATKQNCIKDFKVIHWGEEIKN